MPDVQRAEDGVYPNSDVAAFLKRQHRLQREKSLVNRDEAWLVPY